MRIALFAHNQFPLEATAASVRAQFGMVEVSSASWEKTLYDAELPAAFEVAVLIVLESEVVRLGERTKEARLRIGEMARLIVCAPRTTASDREILKQCGADRVIVPPSRAPERIAERIAAELMVLDSLPTALFGSLRGGSSRMRDLYEEIETVASVAYPVLILGETGTGKDLIAREIHRCSGRPEPFLKLNCAEVSPELLRSELFGHTKGAFTSADRTKTGLMAEAGGGTLFLDEIGELDLQAQAMLLQVLEDRQFRPIGAPKLQEFRARLVLATHRDLDEAVDRGRFRRDLFARINDFILYSPALRERRADILLLTRHFIEAFNRENPGRPVQVPDGAFDCLFEADWPENVRQLLKVIRKAATFRAADGSLRLAYLQDEVRKVDRRREQQPGNVISFNPALDRYRNVIRRTQEAYFKALLQFTEGNKEKAIRISGLGKSRFYELLKELEAPEDREEELES